MAAAVEDCAGNGGAGLRVGGAPTVPDATAGTIDRTGAAAGELEPHAASDAIIIKVPATLATCRILTTESSDMSRPAELATGPI